MKAQTAITKYFSGDVELRGAYPLPRTDVRALFPSGKIQKYDSFNLLVGTVDGRYRTSDGFLPVTRIIRYNEAGSKHQCGGRCVNAKGGDCECACGGKNHGAGN